MPLGRVWFSTRQDLFKEETFMADYAHGEVLVSTQWVAGHLKDPELRLVEVDVDTSAYDQGHVPGAVGWNWQTQLQDTLRRNLATKEECEKRAGASEISNDSEVVLYGDNNN
jgi:thiosulfate/3-mercaptopyruvate sulfurtransferase